MADHLSLPSPRSHSGLCSPLTTSDDDDDCLSLHMPNHMPVSLPAAAAAFATRDMQSWADLFTDSPRSSLWQSPGLPAYKSGYPSRDARPAHEPGNPDKVGTVASHGWNHDLTPALQSLQTLQSNTNWTEEEKLWDIRPERALKQANSGTRKPRGKNNQWKTRRGECYVGLSLAQQQQMAGGGSDTRAAFLGDGESRNGGSVGTGVFLPKTVGKVGHSEQGRKQTSK